MNEPAMAIKAVFFNWRPVVGHKKLQLIFEVPIEQTTEVLTMLGAPMPDKETWCAIALLDLGEGVNDEWQKGRRTFCDLPFRQQAGIKSNDLTFKLWMSKRFPEIGNGEDCASAIRDYCGVISRTEILPGTKAGDKWLKLLREFEGVR